MRRPVLDQAAIALGRTEGEGEPRLHDEVEPLLELVGHAEVPHRRGNKHPIGEREAQRHALDDGEGVALGVAERASAEARVFGLERRAVELRQGLAPQILDVDVPGRPSWRNFARNASAPAEEAEPARGEQRKWKSFGTYALARCAARRPPLIRAP